MDNEKNYGSVGTRVGEITSIGISDTIRADLGLKGGGLPQFVLPEVADVDFVYLLNPNITVSATSDVVVRQVKTDVGFSVPPNALTLSTQVITVPNGANRITASFIRTDSGASAALYVSWDYSYDGTTWFNAVVDQSGSALSQNGVISTMNNATANSGANNRLALPPYVRAGVQNNDLTTTATGTLMLVVS